MEKYIPLSVVLAELEKRIKDVNSLPKQSYEIGLFDAYKIILSFLDTLEVKEVDLELITGWFDHIAQIADGRKTANGKVMEDWAALDEIKCLARESSEFIRIHLIEE